MAYGARLPDVHRRAATYVDKLLKGAKPADLPVEQPTTFELVIDLRTAKVLGRTIPPPLLLRASQVLELLHAAQHHAPTTGGSRRSPSGR